MNNINNNSYTSFKGQLRLVGTASNKIKTAFYNEKLEELAKKSEYDIVGILKRFKVSGNQAYISGRDDGEIEYKFTLTTKKVCKTMLEKILNLFSTEERPLVKAYRKPCSEDTICHFIKRLSTDIESLKDNLKI